MKTLADTIEHYAKTAVNQWYGGAPTPLYHVAAEIEGIAFILEEDAGELKKAVKDRFDEILEENAAV